MTWTTDSKSFVISPEPQFSFFLLANIFLNMDLFKHGVNYKECVNRTLSTNRQTPRQYLETRGRAVWFGGIGKQQGTIFITNYKPDLRYKRGIYLPMYSSVLEIYTLAKCIFKYILKTWKIVLPDIQYIYHLKKKKKSQFSFAYIGCYKQQHFFKRKLHRMLRHFV